LSPLCDSLPRQRLAPNGSTRARLTLRIDRPLCSIDSPHFPILMSISLIFTINGSIPEKHASKKEVIYFLACNIILLEKEIPSDYRRKKHLTEKLQSYLPTTGG